MKTNRKDRELENSGPPPAGDPLVVSEGSGRTAVALELSLQGDDYLLQVTGGRTHVGAVAVAFPGGAELMTVPGHREGPLAAECAAAVAAASGRTCAVVAGIHQDGATSGEIAAIVDNVRRGLEAVLLRAFPTATEPGENHE